MLAGNPNRTASAWQYEMTGMIDSIYTGDTASATVKAEPIEMVVSDINACQAFIEVSESTPLSVGKVGTITQVALAVQAMLVQPASAINSVVIAN